MTDKTIYWHDYETFGIDPARDRPAQFAGIRTDGDLNVIEAPQVVYCRLAEDSLPHPDACLITGITPQLVDQKGVCEAEFIALIHEQLARPNTCTVGYNNLRFDDEVTRNCLYRNFYDPYAREWQNGNSRWDLIDVLRTARALRPEGMQWPADEEGKASFRLDQLTIANNIPHESAHDALADVYATIAIAKIVKQAQPKLYQFLWQHRLKIEVLNLLQLGSFKPVVHVSGRYPAIKYHLAIVLPLCKHPTNVNGVIVYDLSIAPEPLSHLSIEEIRQRIFTATSELPDGITRIPLKTVHINKCPVIAPLSVLRKEELQRLEIDMGLCNANIAKIKAIKDLPLKIAAVFSDNANFEKDVDPDLAIYSGGFFSESDKQKMAKIRTMPPERLAQAEFKFKDRRLFEMLFRYRARNYPHTLNADETQKWQRFCFNRLTGQQAGAGLTLDKFSSQLKELRGAANISLDVIDALDAYADQKKQWLSAVV